MLFTSSIITPWTLEHHPAPPRPQSSILPDLRRPVLPTRQRLQPGVLRLLPAILSARRILDLGCGNGELARQLQQRGFQGSYLGLDFSAGLLAEGRPWPAPRAVSLPASSTWPAPIGSLLHEPPFDLVMAFAVLHHLPVPGAAPQRPGRRSTACSPPAGASSTPTGSSSTARASADRIQPWSAAGSTPAPWKPGDYLLDWRQGGSGAALRAPLQRARAVRAGRQSCGFTLLDMLPLRRRRRQSWAVSGVGSHSPF